MANLSVYQSWYGRDVPPEPVTRLQAGGLSLEFEQGDLRYIRAGGRELVRRIYVAVRDPNWNTIGGLINNLEVQAGADRFRIQYDSFHQAGPLAFSWHADYVGFPDGHIEVSLDGAAETDFRYNRIGFCLLHPIQGIAGRPYQAQTPQGPVEGKLPVLIGAQQMVNGFEAPLFPSCSALSIDLEPGVRLVSEFEGDLFEMEDQRNWTDGSFKTYGTPLSLGYPHQAAAGQAFHQRIVLRVEGLEPADLVAGAQASPAVQLSLAQEQGRRLPAVGFGLAESSAPTPAEIDLLARLRADHLKVSLHLGSPGWTGELERGIDTAEKIGAALELAVFLDDHPEEALQRLAARLRGKSMARVIVFHESQAAQGSTSAQWMQFARGYLAEALPGVALVGGTNGNFAELNRQPPEIAAMDGVAYTINPQVHAFDERSLVEAIGAQTDTLITARGYCAGLPLSISSVTLKPPFNQAAGEPEAPRDLTRLPPAVDPRQMSLFAAAWTVGSLAALSAGGAESVTFYQTSGWQGLMETQSGNPLPDKFPSYPGMVFPVYWVFAFLAEAKQGNWQPVTCTHPLLAGGLALKQAGRTWLLLTNYQAADQPVQVAGLPPGQGSLRRINQETMQTAGSDPAAFRAQQEPVRLQNEILSLTLSPYETVCIDLQPGG